MRSIIKESWFFIAVHYWQKEIFEIPSHQIKRERPAGRVEKTFGFERIKIVQDIRWCKCVVLNQIGEQWERSDLGGAEERRKTHFTAWLFDLVKWFWYCLPLRVTFSALMLNEFFTPHSYCDAHQRIQFTVRRRKKDLPKNEFQQTIESRMGMKSLSITSLCVFAVVCLRYVGMLAMGGPQDRQG